jgi:hypothetical protein
MRLGVQAAESFKAVDLNWCHPNGAAALRVCLPVDLDRSNIRKMVQFLTAASTNDRLSQQIQSPARLHPKSIFSRI